MAPAMAAEETPLMATSPAFVSLCLNSAGVVDISASSRGEVAMGDTLFGGYFTHNFVSFLREKKDEQLTWPVLINDVRVKTREYFIREQPDGVDNPFIPERTQRTQTVEGRFQGAGSDSSTMPTDGPRFGVLAVSAPGGVVVKEVVPNSPATRVFLMEIGQTVALEAGDLITRINGIAVQGEEGYGALIDASSKRMTLTLVNIRDGREYTGTVELSR
jgi:hypothetical protein